MEQNKLVSRIRKTYRYGLLDIVKDIVMDLFQSEKDNGITIQVYEGDVKNSVWKITSIKRFGEEFTFMLVNRGTRKQLQLRLEEIDTTTLEDFASSPKIIFNGYWNDIEYENDYKVTLIDDERVL